MMSQLQATIVNVVKRWASSMRAKEIAKGATDTLGLDECTAESVTIERFLPGRGLHKLA
jgi:hypothetical protein